MLFLHHTAYQSYKVNKVALTAAINPKIIVGKMSKHFAYAMTDNYYSEVLYK